MHSVPTLPMIGLVAQLVVLAALMSTVGFGGPGAAVGLACAVITGAALVRGLARSGGRGLGPADHVTLTRAMLACGVAALTVNSFSRPSRVAVLVAIAVVALLLDAVDGWVARHTRTASALGARFDMEVDAFLILVLSVCVARTTGWWVLAIFVALGAASLVNLVLLAENRLSSPVENKSTALRAATHKPRAAC